MNSEPKRRRVGQASRLSPPENVGQASCLSPSNEDLLARLERCAAQCAEVERVLGARNLPELETIIKLHRLLILRFSLEAESSPELLKVVEALMKPVMDWARLDEKRKEREFAEQQAQAEAEQGAQSREQEDHQGPLQPETLEKIQEELSLL